jgi:hypothetical protein
MSRAGAVGRRQPTTRPGMNCRSREPNLPESRQPSNAVSPTYWVNASPPTVLLADVIVKLLRSPRGEIVDLLAASLNRSRRRQSQRDCTSPQVRGRIQAVSRCRLANREKIALRPAKPSPYDPRLLLVFRSSALAFTFAYFRFWLALRLTDRQAYPLEQGRTWVTDRRAWGNSSTPVTGYTVSPSPLPLLSPLL